MAQLTKQVYYKITNDAETHRDHQYHDGLNILKEPLGETNGFHFASRENIHNYYSYGFNLREVQIPDGAQVRTGNDFQSFRTDMIFLGTKHSLRDPMTYQKLGLDIVKNGYLLNEFCMQGKAEMLHHWDTLTYLRPEISLSRLASFATQRDHIPVLDWLRSFADRVGAVFPFCSSAVAEAAEQNKNEIVSWWANNFEKPQRRLTKPLDVRQENPVSVR